MFFRASSQEMEQQRMAVATRMGYYCLEKRSRVGADSFHGGSAYPARKLVDI